MKIPFTIIILIILTWRTHYTQAALTPNVTVVIPSHKWEANDRAFHAWDCSEPLQLKAVQPPPPECTKMQYPVRQEEAVVQVLQEAEYIRTEVKVCKFTMSKAVFYCGATDHQTHIPQLMQIQRRVRVTEDECHLAWTKGKFKDTRGGLHDVHINSTTYITYEETGVTSPGLHHTDCEGGSYTADGKQVNGVNVGVHMSVELSMDEGIIRKGQLTLYGSQRELPCRASKGYCLTNSGTYLWTNPEGEEACRLHQTRTTKGIKLAGDDGRTTYISKDGSLIRVVIGETVERCGLPVQKTNYEKIFITSDLQADVFHQPLHPSERSPTMYANLQDSYMFGELTQYIREEFANVAFSECRRQTAEGGQELAAIAAEHRAALDGETAGLGGGVFVSAAGEAWYRYQCRRVVVLGEDLDRCYSSLPVRLPEEDEKRYLKVRGQLAKTIQEGQQVQQETPTHIQFFIEPKTHRLTTIGIPLPCTAPFPALYQSLSGQWWQVNPILVKTTAPEMLESDLNHTTNPLGPPDLDFEQGGLYTAEDVREMDLFSQTPRKVQDVVVGLGSQGTRGYDGHVSPHMLFPEMPDIDYAHSFFASFWLWLDRWGSFMAICIGLGMIIKLITFLTGLALRLLALHKARGVGWHLVAALLPSLLLHRLQAAVPPREVPLQDVTIQRNEEMIATAPSLNGNLAEREATLITELASVQRARQVHYNQEVHAQS